ncbi:MAG: hypothetical protein AB4426_21485 [Xenococcaceae cyanobacterium]
MGLLPYEQKNVIIDTEYLDEVNYETILSSKTPMSVETPIIYVGEETRLGGINRRKM